MQLFCPVEQAKHARRHQQNKATKSQQTLILSVAACQGHNTCVLTCHVVQVRHFAAHYAGDEGLARPFSAMPSDRNLAWSSQPSPERPATRLRPDTHTRDQSPATSSAPPQVSSSAFCSMHCWIGLWFTTSRGSVRSGCAM